MSVVTFLVAVAYLLADRWLSLPAGERARRREQLMDMFGGTPGTDP